MKKKILGANEGEIMTNKLNKASMTRSKLRNKYPKEKNANSKIYFTEQRNYCVTKSNYFGNINSSSITDNKNFWKIFSPCFSDKISLKETIIFSGNDIIISDHQ